MTTALVVKMKTTTTITHVNQEFQFPIPPPGLIRLLCCLVPTLPGPRLTGKKTFNTNTTKDLSRNLLSDASYMMLDITSE